MPTAGTSRLALARYQEPPLFLAPAATLLLAQVSREDLHSLSASTLIFNAVAIVSSRGFR